MSEQRTIDPRNGPFKRWQRWWKGNARFGQAICDHTKVRFNLSWWAYRAGWYAARKEFKRDT